MPRAVVEAVPTAEMFLYQGSGHLFADPGLPHYNKPATTPAKRRVPSLLAKA